MGAGPADALIDLLRRASIRVAGGDADTVELVLPDRTAVSVRLRIPPKSPDRGALRAAAQVGGPRNLYLVQTPSSALLAAARAGRVDLVATTTGEVLVQGRSYLPEEGSTDDARAGSRVAVRRGRWGHWAVERILLLAGSAMTQREIADAAGITQQAVSKILRGPAGRAAADGRSPRSVGSRLDRWVEEYPGPGGIAAGWYHLDPVTAQARAAAGLAAELGIDALFAADVAADSYAPWRLPLSAELYTEEAMDLAPAGFVPAGPADATLTVRVPGDRTVFPVARWYADSSPAGVAGLADPILVYWALTHSDGPDADDAAGALREAIVEGRLRV